MNLIKIIEKKKYIEGYTNNIEREKYKSIRRNNPMKAPIISRKKSQDTRLKHESQSPKHSEKRNEAGLMANHAEHKIT